MSKSPVLMVELGTTALWGQPDRALIASGTPVVKRYSARSSYSRFIWVAQDGEGTYHAFVPNDPLSGCHIHYSAEMKKFHDPCWGAVYDLNGKHVAGPGTDGLWSQPVTVEEGQITVDLTGAPVNQ
jgi:nitrite reductase/ring-hydroxylating ferredoxin subunit